jgi:cation transport protein ChaC
MLLKSILSAVFTSFCLFCTTFSVALHHHPLRRFSLHSFPRQASNIRQKMSEWDSENGVWIGDKAIFSEQKIPSPLYLFGYGSLLWRPGDLSEYESYSCLCDGWQRLFAQRSSDHRGSVEFPGFVCTLVEESFLARNSNSITSFQSKGKIECSGLVWKIPDDKVEATIKELDYRERGGYHR